jgi:hypothetical protein
MGLAESEGREGEGEGEEKTAKEEARTKWYIPSCAYSIPMDAIETLSGLNRFRDKP